jgi:hypothetical protein
MKKLTTKDVVFHITSESEDTPVRGNAMASGDDEQDREAEDRIIADMESNEWAWCSVKVTAVWQGFRGSAYLGCCSYKDREDFEKGGYLPQMQEEALETLNTDIARIAAKLMEIGFTPGDN